MVSCTVSAVFSSRISSLELEWWRIKLFNWIEMNNIKVRRMNFCRQLQIWACMNTFNSRINASLRAPWTCSLIRYHLLVMHEFPLQWSFSSSRCIMNVVLWQMLFQRTRSYLEAHTWTSYANQSWRGNYAKCNQNCNLPSTSYHLFNL